ncbi:MAG: DPP IV N-terminal domain-containing protein [Bacteroidaceae bacterium]|nr:DPP IV N-terminal domain-containing protein [Bacteroidaceae bacterium]
MISQSFKKISLLLSAALTIGNLMAQELKMPTLDDLLPGGETYRYAENLYGLQWWGDVLVKPEIDRVVTVDLRNGKETLLAEIDDISDILKKNGIDTNLPSLQNVQLLWPGESKMLVRTRTSFYVLDWKNKTVVAKQEMPRGAANADFNNNSCNLAYTINNNLYVNGKQLTDEPEGIVVGQSVHRNEFGINKGTFWSPKGNLLAFYNMDESMVTEYPLVDIDARVGELNPVRYPMAGMTSHKVKIGIYDVNTDKTIYLDAGDPTDRYFTNISWAPDEKSIWLIELNRDQNHAKLCQYDVKTGKLMGVFYEEENPKYVEPENPIVFLPWDPRKFIYQSERDGFNHLYLMDTQTSVYPEKHSVGNSFYKESFKTTQLTKGNWLVQGILGFNEAKKEIIYSSTEVSPLQTNIYKVNVKNGTKTTLNDTEGVHRAQISASGTYLIDNYSTPTEARIIDVYDTTGKGLAKAINLLTAEDPLKGFLLPLIETGTIKASDGKTELYYRICKPADFDPTKKYPAIVYVYGGPHAQMIHNDLRYDARGWDLYMANKGYIMFTLDNRGSDNRGFEFESTTFRHLGVEESKDQVKGVEFLKSLPYVDANRIGVHGWSFGGHMTTSLMLRYPEIYKVGVAGGPVIDWAFYEVMYGERYMDTPQANPDGYKETNLRNLAGNLKGHLLMIHDYQDETCVPQHTLSFIKACVDARTYPDLFIYPGHPHNVSGRDRIHLHEKITRYFEDNL